MQIHRLRTSWAFVILSGSPLFLLLLLLGALSDAAPDGEDLQRIHTLESTLERITTDFAERLARLERECIRSPDSLNDSEGLARPTSTTLDKRGARQSRRALRRLGVADSVDVCRDLDGPQLYVDGTCSCEEDVLIANGSVSEDLRTTKTQIHLLNESLQNVEAWVQDLNTTVQDCCATAPDPPCKVASVPSIAGVVKSPFSLNGASAVALSSTGTLAYVTGDQGDTLAVVNVTNASQPVVVSTLRDVLMDGPYCVALAPSGTHVFVVAKGSLSFLSIDVQDPGNPVVDGTVQTLTPPLYLDSARDLVVSPDGNYAFVVAYSADALSVIDVSDVTSPSFVDYIAHGNDLAGASGIVLSPDGTYAYVTAANYDQVTVVDVSNPGLQTPSIESGLYGYIDTPDDLVISLDGKTLYVTGYGTSDVMVSFSINGGATPVLAGTLHGEGVFTDSHGLALSPDGSLLYILGYSMGSFVVVSVADAANPTVNASMFGLAGPWDVAVSPDGTRAYVAGYDDDSLTIVDLWGCV